MKKLILLLVVAVALTLSVTSCKTHEKCPAYGHAGSVR